MSNSWGPSRFNSSLAEKLWEQSMEGWHDREAGDVETIGWYALFLAQPATKDEGAKLPAILSTDEQGFVFAVEYANDELAFDAWARIERADRLAGREIDGLGVE